MLGGRRIVLGVTGGIAAYKAVLLCRLLVDSGAHVIPVMTESAQKFVGRATFDALASEPVRTSIFDDVDPIPHTTLGQTADLIVVAQRRHVVLAAMRVESPMIYSQRFSSPLELLSSFVLPCIPKCGNTRPSKRISRPWLTGV